MRYRELLEKLLKLSKLHPESLDKAVWLVSRDASPMHGNYVDSNMEIYNAMVDDEGSIVLFYVKGD